MTLRDPLVSSDNCPRRNAIKLVGAGLALPEWAPRCLGEGRSKQRPYKCYDVTMRGFITS